MTPRLPISADQIPTEPLAAAYFYASLGIRMVPMFEALPDGTCACGKPECKNIGKHPRINKWGEAATTDPYWLDKWFGEWWPSANIAALTGANGGRSVLDVDTRSGGEESLLRLESENGPVPATVIVITGSGGMQMHFDHPIGRHVKTCAGELAPGLDIRGDGGMAMLPPSIHKSQNRYTWGEIVGANGESCEGILAPMPEWLIPKGKTAPQLATTPDDPVGEGTRNAVLTALAGAMRRQGAPQEAINLALAKTNELRCRPPLDEKEIATIATSIARYAPAPLVILTAGGFRAGQPSAGGYRVG